MMCAAAAAPLTKCLTEGQVLIIDDQPAFLRKALPPLLHREGYRCEFATTSAEAFELLEKKVYTIILMDFNLGSGEPHNGETLTRELRKRGITAIIFSFSSDDADPACHAGRLAAGMTDILGKPFHMNTFKKLVGRHLNS